MIVLEEGFEYQGRRYASLSRIATLITGTRWSGPVFFGLKETAGDGFGAERWLEWPTPFSIGGFCCAVYTRKSSEEGLEQEFNSLHAQREACEAFIRSQRHEGWVCLPQAYDDGGFSGGTLDRPALQRLLTDIGEGKVDHDGHLQDRPPDPLVERFRQDHRGLRGTRCFVRVGDAAVQHDDINGPADPQCPAVLCPVRTRGRRRAHPRICLGCMSYGAADSGNHAWSLAEEEARPFIKRALEGGINFFDTANRYSLGSSEEILGRAIKDFARRDEVVIATKVYGRMRPGPNGSGLSRKAIMSEIDASLHRLGMDYVDLYQIHRWDHETPIEETIEALYDVVKAGKARYIGASSMYAWQFAQALAIAERNGWTRFVSMQNLVNLLYREEEREMLPLCAAEGIGVIPWSPQARGRLTRDWDYTSTRTETDEAITRLFAKTEAADKKVADRVAAVAAARGVSRAQVALAWLLAKPVITAPIVGATKLHHLDDALASVNVKLSAEEIASLEEPYVPHQVVGFL